MIFKTLSALLRPGLSRRVSLRDFGEKVRSDLSFRDVRSKSCCKITDVNIHTDDVIVTFTDGLQHRVESRFQ